MRRSEKIVLLLQHNRKGMRFRLLIVLSCLLFPINVLAGNTTTIDVSFMDFPKGSSYAENEKHDLGNGLIIYTTQCHFTEQLRIKSRGMLIH